MDVVEHEHERPDGRAAREGVAERAVGPVAVGAARGPGARYVAERLAEERVREVGLELRRARREHGGARRARLLGEVRQQARLADARLAAQHDEPAGAARQRRDGGVELGALARAADQRGVHGGSVPQPG